MLVFLDTEYTDSLDCDLISIGMVSEDGSHELYLERSDYEETWCSSFVRAAVLPQLGKAGPPLDRNQLAAALLSWFHSLPCEVTVTCDNFTDWELLIDALDGQELAKLLGYTDLREAASSPEFNHAVCRYHESGAPWHHALHDAKASRQGWLALHHAA